MQLMQMIQDKINNLLVSNKIEAWGVILQI